MQPLQRRWQPSRQAWQLLTSRGLSRWQHCRLSWQPHASRELTCMLSWPQYASWELTRQLHCRLHVQIGLLRT